MLLQDGIQTLDDLAWLSMPTTNDDVRKQGHSLIGFSEQARSIERLFVLDGASSVLNLLLMRFTVSEIKW